jgi:hypothetical protein
MRQGPELVDILPGQDLRQRVCARDKEEVRVRTLGPKVTQGINGICRTGTVHINAADSETRV